MQLRTQQLALSLFLTVATAAVAAPPEDPAAPGLEPTQRLQLLLEQMEERQSSIRTLVAEFSEEKESELFLEPVEASGRFYYAAPDQVRWEYERPDPMSLLIRGDELLTWYHGLNRVRRIQVGRQSQQFLKYLGMGSSLETLLDYFTVRFGVPEDREPFRLVLTPRYGRMAHHLEELTLWIGRESWLPERFRYVEPGGDITEYRFAEIRINHDLPAETFELDLPRDVTIHTLGDVAGSR